SVGLSPRPLRRDLWRTAPRSDAGTAVTPVATARPWPPYLPAMPRRHLASEKQRHNSAGRIRGDKSQPLAGVAGEILGVAVADDVEFVHHRGEVDGDGAVGAFGVMGLEALEDFLVLAHDEEHVLLAQQRHAADAVHVELCLTYVIPDGLEARRLGDQRMEAL